MLRCSDAIRSRISHGLSELPASQYSGQNLPRSPTIERKASSRTAWARPWHGHDTWRTWATVRGCRRPLPACPCPRRACARRRGAPKRGACGAADRARRKGGASWDYRGSTANWGWKAHVPCTHIHHGTIHSAGWCRYRGHEEKQRHKPVNQKLGMK